MHVVYDSFIGISVHHLTQGEVAKGPSQGPPTLSTRRLLRDFEDNLLH